MPDDTPPSIPTVSIVLPTYNGSRYLRSAIESVVAQEYADWELIVVNDCSTDSTQEIVDEFQAHDRRIRGVVNQTNQRLPRSLNVGFDAARGKYLSWTSDDNLYRPAAIGTLATYLDSHTDVALVSSDYAIIDDSGARTGATILRDDPYDRFLGACFLYRRAVHEALGGYATDAFLAEDLDFYLRAMARYKTAVIHQELYDYRAHAQSLSGQRLRECARMEAQIRLRFLSGDGRALPWRGRQTVAANLYFRLAHDAFQAGRPDEALAPLLRILLLWPSAFGRAEMKPSHIGQALRSAVARRIGRHPAGEESTG